MSRSLLAILIPLLLLLAGGAAFAAESHGSGAGNALRDAQLQVESVEAGKQVGAMTSALLPVPFSRTAAALAAPESWCQFMPLHFNIKACTYEHRADGAELTLYSGRKGYQSPEDSTAIHYHFMPLVEEAGRLVLQLEADEGPAGTRDYRIRIEAEPAAAGSRLQISTSYRPSFTSTLLTNSYLATLGRDKVGFSRVSEQGKAQLVQGVRGVIERNVVRYYLAIAAYLQDEQLAPAQRHEQTLHHWFASNERYALQLHEMELGDYLSIKHREWLNQQRLQQALNEKQQLAAR